MLVFAVPSLAQLPDDADDVSVVTLGFAGFPDSSPRSHVPESPDLEARIVHSSIEVAQPWRKSETGLFVARAGFRLVRFDMRQNMLSWTPEDLYDIGLALAWDQQLSPGWRLRAAARPHVASDLKNWDLGHLNLEGSLLLRGGHRGRGRYGIGAMMTSIFGERWLLPMVELGWSREDDVLGFELLLPQRVRLIYRPKRSIELGVRGRVEGNRYRVGESAEFPAGAPLEDALVRYCVFTIGPVVQAALSHSTFLTLESGAALVRRFDIESGGQEFDLDLTNDVEFRVGLEVRR